jgi:hypothetical protein
MTNPISAALIETIASIELADEALVNLDFSVALMEQIGHILDALPDDERREFADTATELANQSLDKDRAELIRGIPESLGLT